MAFIVQKFGGTSVANPAARAKLLDKVGRAASGGGKVVVVVSAMGRKGDPYATDTLLSLLDEAGEGATPLVRDLMASTGEVLSAALVAALLNAHGTKAQPLTAWSAGIKAEGPFGDAEMTYVERNPLMALLEAGIVPVVTGFQGVGSDGSLRTIGRGGSDTTAVGIGAFLKAEYVDIFTDVPGVAAADPRVIPEARFLPYLSYGEMYRLAAAGARVLHDKSATLGERHGVRIRVRSTFDEGEGSLIGPERPGSGGPALLGIALDGKGPAPVRVATLFRAGRCAEYAGRVLELGAAAGCSPVAHADPDAVVLSSPAASAPDLARRLYAALADR